MEKKFRAQDEKIEEYVSALFPPEDQILREIRENSSQAGLPDIQVGGLDGRLLEVLAHALSPKKLVELGTLGGYSGVCLLRGAGPNSRLYTFELSPQHAQVAQTSFERAGLGHQVEIHVGQALQQLSRIESEGPFDLVFIDADKANYSNYLEWSAQHLRPGGVVLADNTFAWGMAPTPSMAPERQKKSVAALDEFNRKLAKDPRFRATMLPTGEGLSLGVKR